jgi:hypothetical protein
MSGNVASSPRNKRTRKDGSPGYFADKGSDKSSNHGAETTFKTNDLFARSLASNNKAAQTSADTILSPKDKKRSTGNSLSPSRKASPMFHIQ